MDEYKITFLSEWNQRESEVDMKRRFFRYFKARIPRKLKKAAKYGVTHSVQHRATNTDGTYSVQEIHSWSIQGRSTKWKVKATYKCAAEYKRMINEEMLSWMNRRQDEIYLQNSKRRKSISEGKSQTYPIIRQSSILNKKESLVPSFFGINGYQL